jgi:uncharacterized surface protein with fasciclin (FAS1) repeats
VLTVPVNASLTATNANESYGIAILTKGGFLTGKAKELCNILSETLDMTFFFPNTASALDSILSVISNLTTDQLAGIFAYHSVKGFVGYSSLLRNGTVLQSVQGENLTIYTDNDGSKYVNNAKILETDYLLSNGVFHTIDK